MTFARTASPVDAVADAYVDELCSLQPLTATSLGVTGHDHRMPDLSPDGLAAVAALHRRTLLELETAISAGLGTDPVSPAPDRTDRVTVAAMQERLGLALERYEAGEELREVNVVASAAQSVREVFDLMPTVTATDWAAVAARLDAIPDALHGYTASLRAAAARGHIAALRQVTGTARQCGEFAADEGFFATLAAGARPDGAEPSPGLAVDLERGARAARSAYAELATFLTAELAPLAPVEDGVGLERYTLASRLHLGAAVDLVETYEWGLAELSRIEAEMVAVADRIAPGEDAAEAARRLDADPARRIGTTAALQDWMQTLSDRTVAAMAGTHFDIPEPIRRLDCRIAPSHSGLIYYTNPSADLSRPGTMWWSVPAGVTSFSTWREVSTVFHEGVPGHHLQIAGTVLRAGELNRWRRLVNWVSGHGEGWALYAERLMEELGHLDDPGDHLGMLDGQALRAARVVVDIGVHLGLQAPPEVGGGRWDAEKAWTFLRTHVRLNEATLRFELDRYLGWPGQAPSYKVGERAWLRLRSDASARDGADFDLRRFHEQALAYGSLGLDTLREVMGF